MNAYLHGLLDNASAAFGMWACTILALVILELVIDAAGRRYFRKLSERYALEAVAYQLAAIERLGARRYRQANGQYGDDRPEPEEAEDLDDDQ